MKNIILALAALIAVAACSGSADSVQTTLDNLPVPEVEGTKPEDKNLIEPQAVGDSVPELDEDIAYYGSYPLNIAEPLQMNLTGESAEKAFDLEFIAESDTRFYFDRFWVTAEGECPGQGNEWIWMEVSKDGDVYSFKYVKPFDVLTVQEGSRYLLRVAYTGTSGCEKLSTYMTFSDVL